VNRRNFIKNTGMAGALALLPIPAMSYEAKPKYQMGYQLFSVRDDMDKDPIGTLKALKKMGYQNFETYGFDAEKDMFYGHSSSDFKKILDDLNLTVSSGHYGFAPFLDQSEDALKRFTDQCIKGSETLNSKYITWPWIAPEQRTLETFKVMAEKLNKIGEQVTKAGFGFAYHNHGFEFEDHNGQTGFEIILRDTDPALVKLQMDMYWVMRSSMFTPKELIKNQPGRYVMWHIKDMDKVSKDYTEMGNGSINYLELLPDPATSGLEYYFIEQGGNFSETPMKSAEVSAAYVKKNLRKYL